MQLTLFTLLVTLGTGLGVSAYDVTAYHGSSDCNDSSDSDYYKIFTGSDTNCHSIGAAGSSGATCGAYTDGGVTGPSDCGDAVQTSANSMLILDASCWTYANPDCTGDETRASVYNRCEKGDELYGETVGSFKCSQN
ncbi:MAG: hypothetical protein Q9170_003432 [Blastenia crenularia]